MKATTHSHAPAPTVAAAEALCRARGVRFTPMRRDVYALMLELAAPSTAYDLLDRMQQRLGRRLAPPTVYRALDFLLEQGLVHRLESTNGYLPCAHPGHVHDSVYLVCERCGVTAEVTDDEIHARIAERARSRGFTAARQVVEVQGFCAACRA